MKLMIRYRYQTDLLLHPIAPWMKDPSIVQAQGELEEFRIKSRDTGSTEDRRKYQSNRNRFRKIIREKNLVRKTSESKLY